MKSMKVRHLCDWIRKKEKENNRKIVNGVTSIFGMKIILTHIFIVLHATDKHQFGVW